MPNQMAETVAVAAAPSASETRTIAPATLAERCTALRALARESGLTRTPAGRRALADLVEAARAAEVQLAEKDARIRHLESLSVTDELTGLLNRRGFNRELDRALARARRTGETGVLVLIDLDHFKPINDTHGHEAGDRLLIALAERLEAATRTYDRTARLGGDEFAVWMEGADEAAACRRADGFLAAIAEEAAAYGELDPPLGASIGIAPFDPSRRGPHGAVESLDGLLARSDAAMYAAKRAGKGRRAVAAPFDPGAESEAESGANSGPGAAGDGGDAERNQGPETA